MTTQEETLDKARGFREKAVKAHKLGILFVYREMDDEFKGVPGQARGQFRKADRLFETSLDHLKELQSSEAHVEAERYLAQSLQGLLWYDIGDEVFGRAAIQDAVHRLATLNAPHYELTALAHLMRVTPFFGRFALIKRVRGLMRQVETTREDRTLVLLALLGNHLAKWTEHQGNADAAE